MKMKNILTVVFFISVLKAVLTQGFDVGISSYIRMIGELKVIEVALWLMITIFGINMTLNAACLKSTSGNSESKHIVENSDGTLSEHVIQRTWEACGAEDARKAYRYSMWLFLLSALGLVVNYIY